MTGAEFREKATMIFGERKLAPRLAKELDCDTVSIFRWFKVERVPGTVAAAVNAWERLHALGKMPS